MKTSARFLLLLILPALLAACGTVPPVAGPEPVAVDVNHVLAAIRDAGAREQSVIEVMPLADPGIDALRQEARSEAITGHFDAAAATLATALQQHPDAPDLVQDQAELAVRQRDWKRAEQLAYKSWQMGPRLGPLCAKNWQTIAEMHRIDGDAAAVATAERWRAKCHVPAVPRY